jgi:hypothetical protein
MLKSRCKASLRQHSRAKALNRQRRWPIKTADARYRKFAGASRRLPFHGGMHPQGAASLWGRLVGKISCPPHRWNQTGRARFSAPVEESYGTDRRAAVRTYCMYSSFRASALPEMSSPSDRPERCPDSFRVRVSDTQMYELRPRVSCAGAHRPLKVRCSGLDRQRASAAKVRPYRLLVREGYLSFHRQSHKACSSRSLGYRAPLRRIDQESR